MVITWYTLVPLTLEGLVVVRKCFRCLQGMRMVTIEWNIKYTVQ